MTTPPFAVARRLGRFCAVHEASGRYLAEFAQREHAAAAVEALNAAALPCADREDLPNAVITVCHRIIAPHLAADRAKPDAPPKAESEAKLQAKVIRYLESRGLDVERLNTGHIKTEHGSWVRLCKAGTPDVLTLIPPMGRAWYIETKRIDGKERETQLKRHAALRAQGAIVDVVRSVDEVAALYARYRGGE